MGKGIIVNLVLLSILIIALLFIIYGTASLVEQRRETYALASMEMGKMYIFNKMLSSESCVSTGEMGILDKEKLDRALSDGGELECAQLPDYSYKVRVDDLTTGVDWDWEFGYGGWSSKWEDDLRTYVSIVDGDETRPGVFWIKVVSSDPSLKEIDSDTLVCIAGAVDRGYAGEYERDCTFETSKELGIHFKENEVCILNEDGSERRCKEYTYAKCEDETIGNVLRTTNYQGFVQVMDRIRECHMRFENVGGEAKVMEFSCYGDMKVHAG